MFGKVPKQSHTVHDFESIIALLRNKLNWPIPDDGSEFEDLTYYWSPNDLELDTNTQQRIIGCWQLRLFDLRFLNSKNPWGIFFVQFQNNVKINFSSTLLRRVLRGLVDRRRRSDSLPFWKQDRVLFICSTENFQDFGFVHFKGMKHRPIFCGYPPLNDFTVNTVKNTQHLKKQVKLQRFN